MLNKILSKKNPEVAKHSTMFFKTGVGEYGYGDKFLGIRVPEVRKLAQENKSASLKELSNLIINPYHEVRLCVLHILVLKYEKAELKEQREIFKFFIKNIQYVNNWDLVDTSVSSIIGAYLFDKDRSLLFRYSKSKNLWKRRISIISTFYFIKNDDFNDSLSIMDQLLNDKEDLIHKACGWMLREIGKRDLKVMIKYLDKNARKMPRTMLRYAIEKLPEKKRRFYLDKK